MISKDKTYRTRDGREVRIYDTDGEHGQLVYGAVKNPEYGWQMKIWFANGCFCRDYDNKLDLIEVKPRHKRTVWINVHDFHCFAWSSKEHADTQGSRIACIKVELDFAEGDGL